MTYLKLQWFLLGFAMVSGYVSIAQIVNPIAGARGLAMADASVTFNDINSVFSNQAGLAMIERTEVMLFAGQKYFADEIRNFSLAYAQPTSFGTFALNLQYYGFEGYNEQKIGFNYARKLSKNLSLGGQIYYLGYRIPEYGNRGLLSAEIGLRSLVTDEVIVAAHISNPVRVENAEDEKIPTIFNIGVAYIPSKKITISAEAEKEIEFPVAARLGLEYQLANPFYARLGVSTGPVLFSFGMGFQLKESFTIDAAASYHQTLGFSPALALRFAFDKQK